MITVSHINDVCEAKMNVTKLTLFASEDVKNTLLALFSRPNLKLLINMQDVLFIDSSGFAALLSASKEAQRTGGQLIFCNIGALAMHLFEVLQLHKSFKIVQDRNEALNSFQ